jgi:diguanylate cyclase (GGDEF)-like protein/PAS domain S-box-containing protein
VGVSQATRSTPPAVTRICLTAAACGAATLGVAAATSGRFAPSSAWLVLALLVAVTATRLVPLHLTHQGNSEALHLDEVFFVPMVVMLAPLQMLGALVVALLVGSAVTRRGGLKLVFNVGSVTTTAGAGILVAHLLGDGTAGWRDYSGAVLGGLVCCAAAAVAVACVISAASGAPVRVLLLDGWRLRLSVWVGSLALGTVVAVLAHGHPMVLAATLAPAALLHLGYAEVVRQRRERTQADALYEAANRIHATVESAAVREALTASARELLFAGTVRIVDPATPERPRSLRVTLDEDAVVEVSDRATGGAWTAGDASRLQALAAVASGALANALLYEQLDAITSSLGEGVLAIDVDGFVTFVNPAAAELLGWAWDELVGRELARHMDPEGFVGGRWVHLPRLTAGETLRLDEYSLVARDGTALDVALTASPVVREGVVTGAVVVLRDVRERKALEKCLVHQAFHDSLTGLPNRALFLDRLEHSRARSLRDGSTQAVLFVDVDRFKVINDSLGHKIGDQVLQAVAARIVAELRPADTVARFGGDEFTVLLESVHDHEEPARAAERILRSLQQPIEAGGREVVVTVSIGIATGEPGNATGDLVAAADIAMYQAKNQGKNRCVIAAEDADERALARLDLETELRRAIADGELEVHYQPVVHAKNGHLYGLEALVRWRHPQWGLVSPAQFMDVAEESGLVVPLGEWVLEQACIAAVEWNRTHPNRPLVMAVNLSARQFQQPDLCDQVSRVLQSTGLDPRLLALEITETVVMDNTEVTLTTLQSLKLLQVRLSIDDFGTGYSSLSYLKRFPVDAIKIDKSFVDGLGSSPVDSEIVQAVIRLAAAVGMQSIAEGVETDEQRAELKALGCSMLQGYLISKPAPMDEINARFSRGVPSPRTSSDQVVRLP